MPLHYLDFDYSEDDQGCATWDAMACVTPAQLPALLDEIAQVLAWAQHDFGGLQAPMDEGGDWDYALQHLPEGSCAACQLHFDPASGQVRATPAMPPEARSTLTLTLCGNAAFGQALHARWGV